MSTTAEKVLSYAAGQPEGTTLSAKELLHLGGRAAVDQALSHLVKRGRRLRVGRGLYASSVKTLFGERPPEPEKVIQALAQHRAGRTEAPRHCSRPYEKVPKGWFKNISFYKFRISKKVKI